MKSVIVRFREYEPHASSAERGIIRYLLEYPEKVAGCSIHNLAETSFSSASTIIRLCRKTGFAGYREMQKAMLYELALRKDTRALQWTAGVSEQDSLEEIIDKVIYKNIASLEDTRKLIDLEVLEQCIKLIGRAENVCLFGVGSSLLVAKDMYLKLLRVNKRCTVSEDWHAQLLQARNMTDRDVALIISYSGMTEEMLICASEVRRRNAPVIAISRFEDSPLAKLADYNLAVAATELILRSGAMSSRISQLGIVDILFTAYVNCHYEECMRQFRRTHIQKPNQNGQGGNEM